MIQKVKKLLFWILFQLLLKYEVYLTPLPKYFQQNLFYLKNFRNNPNHDLLNSDNLKKIPVHLAISIGQDIEFECFDNNGHNKISKYLVKMTDIVYWASVLGIEYISFYDPEGFLKARPQIICQFFTKKFPQCYLENESQITCTSNQSSTQNKYENNNLTVFIRCREDGKKLISLAIEDILLGQQLKSNLSSPITEQLFDFHLNQILYPGLLANMDKSSHSKLNPDLLMICGITNSLKGFLPWHIRNTEIHVLPHLLDLNCKEFERSIQKFADCEQRFGK